MDDNYQSNHAGAYQLEIPMTENTKVSETPAINLKKTIHQISLSLCYFNAM